MKRNQPAAGAIPAAFSAKSERRRVVFVAVPPLQILDLAGPYEVFARCGGYEVEMVAAQAGMVATSSGLALGMARHFAEIEGPIDTLIVPGGDGCEELLTSAALLEWLRQSAQAARRVCSICTGAFVLAQAGLLNGRRVVTHWDWCEVLQQRFAGITVEQAPLFVKDGKFYTSGGVTAGMDLALALVEEDWGVGRSTRIAQELVMFLRRGGSHSQFSTFLTAPPSTSRSIEELCVWMTDHLADDLSVPTLAQECHMSERHFARVFAQEKGITPARYVEQLRVSVARPMLEGLSSSLKHVAAATGFGSVDALRRALKRHPVKH
jgi:transcriptional regulator GlxA family with amidase domain